MADIDWPAIRLAFEAVPPEPVIQIGRRFGVSHTAINKRAANPKDPWVNPRKIVPKEPAKPVSGRAKKVSKGKVSNKPETAAETDPETETEGDDLTPRQERFVAEYLIDSNGTQAAIRAGYSPHSAKEQASRLLTYVNVKAAIDAGRVAQMKRTGLTADWTLERIKRIADISARDVMRWGPDGVTLLPSDEISDEAAYAVSEVSQTISKEGGSIKLKMHDKLGALKLLAQHQGLLEPKPADPVGDLRTQAERLREMQREIEEVTTGASSPDPEMGAA